MKKNKPGKFSLLKPGWFALHAIGIGGMVMLGKAWEKRT